VQQTAVSARQPARTPRIAALGGGGTYGRHDGDGTLAECVSAQLQRYGPGLLARRALAWADPHMSLCGAHRQQSAGRCAGDGTGVLHQGMVQGPGSGALGGARRILVRARRRGVRGGAARDPLARRRGAVARPVPWRARRSGRSRGGASSIRLGSPEQLLCAAMEHSSATHAHYIWRAC